MNSFSERALELACENVEEGGHPFGAVLVSAGEVIAEGVNELHKHPDVSGHAEMLAIRRAQQQRGSVDLSDCVLYASGEPCSMCLTAIYFSGIQTVVYSQSVEEAAEAGLSLSGEVYAQIAQPKESRRITYEYEPVEDQEMNAMLLYAEKSVEQGR
ncbi:nucleoside deaminase [Halobacillus kuroshimensis]|uniref:Nucleoside deaminase n=1 Tax=Halobacillus kuroshimensis TaxID=302481 RepID=A0ABS3DX88_9BACI|nr:MULTISPECIES: nucleoside deaminase [Halobacillus]MBN8235965.1 nucleoside deaminase [Halobacillus kuroshimensis]